MELLSIFGLAGLIWFGALNQALYDYWTLIIFFASITLLLMIFIASALRNREAIRLPLALPLTAGLIAFELSLRHSFDFTTTEWEWWTWVYVFLAAMLFSNAVKTPRARRLFVAFSSAVLIPLAGLAVREVVRAGLPNGLHGVAVTLVNANVLAGFCLFWIFPLLRQPKASWLEKISLACAGVMLALSGSWAAWMALGLGALYLLRARQNARLWAMGIGFGILLLGVIKLAPDVHGPRRDLNRLSYFKASLRMAEREPITGVGLGGYAAAYPYFSTRGVENTRFAHSFPLQFAAETGGVGALAWLFIGFCGWSAYRWNPDPLTRDNEAMIASLIAVGVYSVVSIALDYPLNRWLLMLGVAALMPAGAPWELRLKRASAKIVAMAVILFLCTFWMGLFRAEQLYAAGDYQRAVLVNPHQADAWFQMALREKDPRRARLMRITAWRWKKSQAFIAS